MCKHGWPNAGLRKTRYVVLGMLVHQYHFYLFIFINYLFTKKKRTMHYLVLLSIFFYFKILNKTSQNPSKQHIDLKTKTQFNNKKKRGLFFSINIYEKKNDWYQSSHPKKPMIQGLAIPITGIVSSDYFPSFTFLHRFYLSYLSPKKTKPSWLLFFQNKKIFFKIKK